MYNVITAIFQVESEGYQTITELRRAPFGEDYTVAEAVLLKRLEDKAEVLDSFVTSDPTQGTTTGMLVGSFVGILGGPLGVLLGAGIGASAGGAADTVDFLSANSMVYMVTSKLLEGEVAIIALVEEKEPAFDSAISKYSPTIIRRDAAAVAEDVALAAELQRELENEEISQLRAERKAELKEHYEKKAAEIDDRYDELVDHIDEHFDELKEKREAILKEIRDSAQANADWIHAQEQAEAMRAEMEEQTKEIREDDKHLFGL